MSEIDEQVEFDIDVKDTASPKLSRLEKNIAKVGGAVDRASANFVGMIRHSAMFAGFFALGPAIAGAKHYIDHLDQISDLTGIAADRVGGISNALQSSGVSAAGVENVFARLVKKGTLAIEGNKALIKLGQKYGNTLKDGPEAALIGMAKKLQEGTMSVGQLQRVIGLSAEDAADLGEALSQGPEALARQFDELTKKNAAFSEEAMQGMAEFKNASSRIGEAWTRMTAGIMIKFAPALTKLADRFEHSIEGWADKAQVFGDYLVKHMDTLISMAKTYAKIMLVNVAAQKLTGQGVVGLASRGVGSYMRRAGTLAASGAAAGPMAVLGSFLKGAMSLRPIIQGMLSLGRLSAIGALIGVIVGAFKALGENFNNIGSRLKATFGGIFGTIGRIGAKIASLFDENSGIGKFFGAIGYAFLEVVNKIGEVIGFILTMVEKIVDKIPSVFKTAKTFLFGGPDPLEERASEEEAAYKRGLAKVPKPDISNLKGAKGPQVYQDFRGSRFDIKQSYAEGFDPDRIAVAFANDLSSLGERKLQSGFSPLFTVR